MSSTASVPISGRSKAPPEPALVGPPNFLGTPIEPQWPYRLIESYDELAALALQIKDRSIIEVDTETWGPKGAQLDRDLCLLQLGLTEPGAESGEAVLVDIWKIRREVLLRSLDQGQQINPLAPLKEIFENDQIVKRIFHATFERNQIENNHGIELNSISDLELIARRMFPWMLSHSLAACSREILNETVEKSEQTSDWHARPLTEKQISYAALDVELNAKLGVKLQTLEALAGEGLGVTNSELMLNYLEAHRRELKLIGAEVSQELFKNRAIVESVKESIGKLLKLEYQELGGTDVVQRRTPYGSARYGGRRERVLDIASLTKLFPSLAEEVVYEVAPQGGVERVLTHRFGEVRGRQMLSSLRDEIGEEAPRLRIALDQRKVYAEYYSPIPQNPWPVETINSRAGLHELAREIEHSGALSLHLKCRRNPETIDILQIGLKQLGRQGSLFDGFGAADAGRVYLVDLRTIRRTINPDNPDTVSLVDALAPLHGILESPNHQKILQGRRWTQRIFSKGGISLRGTVDTRLELASLRSGPSNYSLDAGMVEVVGVTKLDRPTRYLTYSEILNDPHKRELLGCRSRDTFRLYDVILEHRRNAEMYLRGREDQAHTKLVEQLKQFHAEYKQIERALNRKLRDGGEDCEPQIKSIGERLKSLIKGVSRIRGSSRTLPGSYRAAIRLEHGLAELYDATCEYLSSLPADSDTMLASSFSRSLLDLKRHAQALVTEAISPLFREILDLAAKEQTNFRGDVGNALAVERRRRELIAERLLANMILHRDDLLRDPSGRAQVVRRPIHQINLDRLRETLSPKQAGELIHKTARIGEIRERLRKRGLSTDMINAALDSHLTVETGLGEPTPFIYPKYGLLYLSDQSPTEPE